MSGANYITIDLCTPFRASRCESRAKKQKKNKGTSICTAYAPPAVGTFFKTLPVPFAYPYQWDCEERIFKYWFSKLKMIFRFFFACRTLQPVTMSPSCVECLIMFPKKTPMQKHLVTFIWRYWKVLNQKEWRILKGNKKWVISTWWRNLSLFRSTRSSPHRIGWRSNIVERRIKVSTRRGENMQKKNIQIPTLAKHPASYCRSSEIPESDEEWSKREEKKTLRTNLGPLWRVKKGFTAESDQVVMTKCAEGEARERKKPASMKHLP